MAKKYQIRKTLKDLPFYSEEIDDVKKSIKKFSKTEILSKLSFFPKKTKTLSNYQLSKELSFFPKIPKKITKHQMLKNILPLYDTVGFLEKQRCFRNYAETYNVEVVDI